MGGDGIRMISEGFKLNNTITELNLKSEKKDTMQ